MFGRRRVAASFSKSSIDEPAFPGGPRGCSCLPMFLEDFFGRIFQDLEFTSECRNLESRSVYPLATATG